MFPLKQGMKRELTLIPIYKAPLTERSKIAFTPCTAVKMNKVHTKPVVVGYDSAPVEGPARHHDCFVRKKKTALIKGN